MNATAARRHRTPNTVRSRLAFTALGTVVTGLLLTALAALAIATAALPGQHAPGAQNRVGAFLSAAPTCARGVASESPCTRPGSTVSRSGIAVGCCVAAKVAPRKQIGPPGNPGALASQDHHVFPQQFKRFFEQRGIDIDEYTVPLGQGRHLRGVHGRGGDGLPGGWNARWRDFIRENPSASAKDVYQFGGRLMDEYGLSGLPIRRYGGPN
jgi:hypothetical protein